MPCERCKRKCGVPIACLYCSGNFCPRCIHLETHACEGLDMKKTKQLNELAMKTMYVREPKWNKI